MEQLRIFTEEKPIKNCVFTGHRDLQEDFSKKSLKNAILEMIKLGADTFFCGMAIGFDLTAAEVLLSLKKKNPSLKLIACIPCFGQEKYFSKADQKRYVSILKKVDEKVILADAYYKGCMQVRDKYMTERADCMIAYCKKKEGGTAYTVRCFTRLHPDGKIIFL